MREKILNFVIKNGEISIPVRFRTKTALNLTNKQNEMKCCIDAIKSLKSVFLFGICGSGKTHAAVAILKEWYKSQLQGSREQCFDKRPQPPIFLPTVELFQQIKSTFGEKASEDDVLRKYSSAKFLVLDDIGVESGSDWSRRVLYTLIDRRYRDMHQTVITSNLSLQKISEQIDDRIASRISEMGIVVEMGKIDFRV